MKKKFPPVHGNSSNYQNMEIDQGVVDPKNTIHFSLICFGKTRSKYMVSKEDVLCWKSFSVFKFEGVETRCPKAEAMLSSK